jgi:hypothetical protein
MSLPETGALGQFRPRQLGCVNAFPQENPQTILQIRDQHHRLALFFKITLSNVKNFSNNY